MPILETLAGVAGIVSAFNASVTLYRSWRDKNAERRANEQNQRLETSLTIGGTTIQQEYDNNFLSLGQVFAVGDDRSRTEIAQYVITIQHAIITMLTESNSSVTIVIPNLTILLSTSENTRTGVIRALGELYQRMLQAMPLTSSSSASARLLIQATPAGLPGMECPLPERRLGTCTGSIRKDYTFFKCTTCRLFEDHHKLELMTRLVTKDGVWVGIPAVAIFPWHSAGDPNILICQLCPPGQEFCFEMISNEWGIHCRSNHTQADFEQLLGCNNVRRCTCDTTSSFNVNLHGSTCLAKLRGLELYTAYDYSPTNWRRSVW